MSEEHKKRIDESKKKTQCRVCGQLGHWAGEPECAESDKKLAPRGDRGRFKKGGKGKGKVGKKFNKNRTKTS